MEQFEQLLTCAICLDRYRNPKLLPCQHSFCMEPCMDGLVDYVRRQVKCPECRAEHRIPYQGVQGYPTNVTLQRFLELHIEITGELPDPTSGQVMKRCSVCSEKSYVAMCGHCDKEVCADCKGAHMDILRREIARINSQVRRALHRLQDMLALVERNMLALQTNCHSVSEEVEEIHNRLTKALKDRTEFLQGELDRYLSTELKNLSQLKDNLELEISNISSNCDLADEHMANENVEWDDLELMDAKEIFLRTVEFIRNFETETTDYTRRVRFVMSHDPNTLVLNVAGYGELSINMPHPVIQSLQPPGPGLMRSKSDHRLASQYRGEDRGYDRSPYDTDPMQGRVSPLGGRKFGERPRDRVDLNSGSRYGGRNDRDYGDEYDPEGRQTARSRIRARFRHGAGDADSDSETHGGRSVRFNEPHGPPAKEREKVLDTEDVAKGPLSGITRLLDSPRVMKKLLESEIKKTKKENEPAPPPPAQNKAPIIRKTSGTNASAPVTQRQVSEDDEIARIKKQNKNVASSSETATREPVRPSSERVAALKQQSSADQRTPERSPSRRPSTVEVTSSEADSDEEVAAIGSLRKTSTTASPPGTKPASRRVSTEVGGAKPDADSTSASPNRTRTSSDARRGSVSSTSSNTPATASTTQAKPFQSRFLGGGNRPSTTTTTTATPAKSTPPATKEEEEEDDDDEEETEEETETSSESEETESEEEAAVKKPASGMEKTDIGPLLARSANARDTAPAATSTSGSSARDAFIASRYNTSSDSRDSSSYKPFGSKDETSTTTGSKYSTGRNRLSDDDIPSRYGTTASQSRARPSYETDSTPSRYGTSSHTARAGSIGASLGTETSPYTSRFLNKSKSAAVVSPEDEKDESSLYSSGRTRFAALKDRKARLARSKSSHALMLDDEEFDDGPNSPYSPAAYLASKAAAASSSVTDFPRTELARSRSSHTLKSRDNSPDRVTSGYSSNASAGGEKDGAALSSWARYLKSKYGNRGKEGAGPSSSGTASGTSTPSRRSSLHSRHGDESDDESKNMYGSPNDPIQTTAQAAQTGIGQVGTTPRSQYLQKRRLQFKIGSRGSEPGCFTWPRGIAVGPDNSIVVADSSNHRVQVFDSDGIFTKEFGSYGNAEGEFDCLAGVAVNRIGQFIIADRYNHRIQVMDPSGRFLRAFGSQGTADGKFNYPWGITTDALGFIYVCDKENHRVQVFQSDGTFVGKFGSMGNKAGQLEHPHYIAVSNTNRVIVSDSNNHRVQIFDVNGRVITSFGSEGSEEGQFKFPRGVAVDDQGYISVGDSGNNRIQIFTPDGQFLRAFGCWGSGDGEFKGLEGVAVMSNGNILVCDRENHRIQVF